jgi:hypothetical protein
MRSSTEASGFDYYDPYPVVKERLSDLPDVVFRCRFVGDNQPKHLSRECLACRNGMRNTSID